MPARNLALFLLLYHFISVVCTASLRSAVQLTSLEIVFRQHLELARTGIETPDSCRLLAVFVFVNNDIDFTRKAHRRHRFRTRVIRLDSTCRSILDEVRAERINIGAGSGLYELANLDTVLCLTRKTVNAAKFWIAFFPFLVGKRSTEFPVATIRFTEMTQ